MGGQETAGRLQPAHRGSREARPPPHRQAAGPVPPAGRSAGAGVLAPQGLEHLAGGRAVHEPRVPRHRLWRGALPADPRRRALEEIRPLRSEEPTSELQSLMRISYAVFCLKKKTHLYTKIIILHIIQLSTT